MKVHEVKTEAEFFAAVRKGLKMSEVRFNDRNYQVGDVLVQHEIDQKGKITGESLCHEITHVLSGGQFGLDKQWCVLSLVNTVHMDCVALMEHLRDRLVEAADCMDAGIEVAQAAQLTTDDIERQVADSRFFADEATRFLNKLEVSA